MCVLLTIQIDDVVWIFDKNKGLYAKNIIEDLRAFLRVTDCQITSP